MKTLFKFSTEISNDILDNYGNMINKDDYSPESIFEYLNEWGDINNLSDDEIINEFNWSEMTMELGLPI